MQLGEFARHGHGAAGKRRGEVVQRLDDAVRAFEEDERGLELFKFREQPSALALLLRHEAREEKAVSGEPGECEAGEHGGRAGAGGDGNAKLHRLLHQPVAGVGDERHASIADERNGGALLQPLQNMWPRLLGIVLMVRGELRPDGEALHQFAGGARVLAQHGFGGGKGGECAHRDIAQIADGGCHHIEPRRQRLRLIAVGADDVAGPGICHAVAVCPLFPPRPHACGGEE